MLIIGAVVVCIYIVRYAERVKKDPSKSMVGFEEGDKDQEVTAHEEKLSTMNQFVLVFLL